MGLWHVGVIVEQTTASKVLLFSKTCLNLNKQTKKVIVGERKTGEGRINRENRIVPL